MNLLTITLCVLLEVLIAKTQRLPADSFNTNKLVAYGAPSATLLPDVISNYPQPNSKPLYNYSYNTDTGIRVQEDGHINHINTEQEALEARGSYSFTDAEGNTFQVSYVANENGFQPKGAHCLKYHH
ncbi:cuticle protein CP14.6-like isoform X1 [Nylanderia fulva]|uniref:cuticle protein CP14.6-like isoform X1 n=1 Tax=Nylanderia fulva TaxID=613905 RepID=UPI0010FB706A|nr:cuticle protein CP14.6-like isoform X1 [Nylanderia fulva]